MLNNAELRRQKQVARRRARFYKELKEHLRSLPARAKAARAVAVAATFLLSEPFVGWMLAAVLAAGLLCALFIRLTQDSPTLIGTQ
jgi:hypothetical protein